MKSQRGTQFRIWANSVLKDYILKGYAANDKLKIEQYAESRTEEKDMMVKVVVNLINGNY